MNRNLNNSLEIHFNFFCRSYISLENKESPIVFRIIFRGERKDVFTGIYCQKKIWMKKERLVNLIHPAATEINKQLRKILAAAESNFQKLKFSGEEFSLDDLIRLMKCKTPPPQTIQEYMVLKDAEQKKRIGIEITHTTWYKYKRTINYLSEFLLQKTGNKNIPVSRIDLDFIKSFFMFLRKEKKNCHNSATALMCCLKSILLPAVKNRVIKVSPFDQYVMKREPVVREFLELHEIKQLENLKDLNPELTLKRDAFIFACFTGLPYGDLKKLSRIHIQEDNDGSFNIKHSRLKTGVLSIIPLLPPAEKILLKYSPTEDFRDFNWEIPSNAKFNEGLKKLAKLAGIVKPVFVHLGRHTFATTVTLSNNVSLESVSKMLGHTSMKHTQIYAKVVAAKVKSEMKGVRDFFS